MRTRTNLYIGEGEDGFLKILKNFYAEGCVEVVFDDGKEVALLVKKLQSAGYHVILTHAEEYEGREYFAVAAGKAALSAVKNSAKGRFAVLPSFLTPSMFTGRLAEFVYIDANVYRASSEKARECYVALLCAEAEGLAAYYRSKSLPFADKGLKRTLEKGRGILLGESDREDFVKESLAVCKELSETVYCGGSEIFTAVEMGENAGGELGDYAECACFLHRTLILFTKWNFRDMLITVAKPLEGVAAGKPAALYSELLIDDEDMKKIFSFVGDFRRKKGVDALIKIFDKSVTEKDVAFAEIYNRGIYEGLKDYG